MLSPEGRRFTEESIGDDLATRDLLAQLRDGGAVTGGPPPFGAKDRPLASDGVKRPRVSSAGAATPAGAGARMRPLACSALLFALAPGWAAAPSRAAEPEWTAAVTAASDYYYRGVSQTLNEPALQADLAIEHASGWFGSLFASTVGFPERPYEDLGTFELAAQVGYGHALGRGWTAVGSAAHYAYPNAEIGHDYLELGVGVDYRGVAASFGWVEDALGYAGSGRIWELVASRSLPWRLGLNAGVGLYELTDLDDEYAFWHVALTRPLGRFSADLGYYGSDGAGRRLFGPRADPRLVVGLAYRIR